MFPSYARRILSEAGKEFRKQADILRVLRLWWRWSEIWLGFYGDLFVWLVLFLIYQHAIINYYGTANCLDLDSLNEDFWTSLCMWISLLHTLLFYHISQYREKFKSWQRKKLQEPPTLFIYFHLFFIYRFILYMTLGLQFISVIISVHMLTNLFKYHI